MFLTPAVQYGGQRLCRRAAAAARGVGQRPGWRPVDASSLRLRDGQRRYSAHSTDGQSKWPTEIRLISIVACLLFLGFRSVLELFKLFKALIALTLNTLNNMTIYQLKT